MYQPILQQMSSDDVRTSLRVLESNLLCMHEELTRVLLELYERLEWMEAQHDIT